MDVERDRIPDLVSIHVVERLLSGSIVTIAIGADGVCFGLHESVGPRRVALGKSYVVELYHIACYLFPGALALPRRKTGALNFQSVAVPLFVSFSEQLCVLRVEEKLDIP